MTDAKAPWPPDPVHENSLGAVYSYNYEKAACERGDSAQEAHEFACLGVHREGFHQATGGRPEHKALTELRDAAEDVLRAGAHDGPCDNEDTPDEGCDLHWETAKVREARLRAALDAFARARGEGLCTCTDGSCAREEAPA